MDLLKPSVLKELCARAGMRPEKSSGQNFLISRAVLDRIVATVDPQPMDTILEVGAGFGVLTTALAPRVGRVIAIERDRHIVPILRELVEPYGNVEVVEGDVLRWLRGDRAMSVIARPQPKQSRPLGDSHTDLPGLRSLSRVERGISPRNDTTQPWKLAANLPYSITSDFFRLLFDRVADGSLPPPERAVLLLQREVVDRLCADPKQRRAHKNVGVLTILTQLHCVPRRVATVAPGSFWPAPKVESAIVALEQWRTPTEMEAMLGGGRNARGAFLGMVRMAFAKRRGQLQRTLRRSGFHTSDSALQGAGIDPTARPETLTLTQWIALNRALRS